MCRREDRRRAIELRLQGMSYSQIKQEIIVNKSVLSYWLKDYPLTEDQKKKLVERKPLQIEKFRETMRRKMVAKAEATYVEVKEEMGEVSIRDLLVAGAFLYWGEGEKGEGIVSVSNSNPQMVKWVIYWLEKCYGVEKNRFSVCLHLYNDMDIGKEMNYWSKVLGLPMASFNKPYIKKSTRQALDYKSFGHGTCRIIVSDVKIRRQIDAIIRLFCEQDPSFNGRTGLL